MKNKKLIEAKKNRKDEFYTLYRDIEKEIESYIKYNPNLFKNKIVLLPCDDPQKSNFTKYFIDNFNRFELKELISTCYIKESKGIILRYNGTKKEIKNLLSDGDFRNQEIYLLRDKADFIITNPPFSLFREFFDWVINKNKNFLILGNINSGTYKNVFPYIQKNEVWLGTGIGRHISGFYIPNEYENYATEKNKNVSNLIHPNNCL